MDVIMFAKLIDTTRSPISALLRDGSAANIKNNAIFKDGLANLSALTGSNFIIAVKPAPTAAITTQCIKEFPSPHRPLVGPMLSSDAVFVEIIAVERNTADKVAYIAIAASPCMYCVVDVIWDGPIYSKLLSFTGTPMKIMISPDGVYMYEYT